LIETYATEAIEKSDKRIKSKVFVGLCCSHYGYSTMVFNQVLQKLLPLGFELIDPNETMVRWLLGLNHKNRLSATRVNVDVVSKVEITEQEIQSIAAILEKTSALTANALRKYTHKGDLF
jgi:glutamate racemase